MSKIKVVLPLIFMLTFSVSLMFAATDWLQFAFTPDKTANNTAEAGINTSNVSKLTPLFTVALPSADNPDGAPVLLTSVQTASGTRDLIFVQGEHGTLTAFDANTGTIVWTKAFGTGGTNNSAPAIDPDRQFIYVDGNDGHAHKLNIGDGTEVTSGGWPFSVGGGKGGSQLTIAVAANGHTYLYAANHGMGHITTIDITAGTVHVFNASCSQFPDVQNPGGCTSTGARPWARGNPFVPALDRFYFMTGTNNGNAWNGCTMWKQSWLALPADGSTHLSGGCGFPADSYTPSNQAASVASDQDIGAGGLTVLPTGLSSKFPHLGVQPGKDHNIRLLNLDNLSGQGAPGKLGGEIQLFTFPTSKSIRAQGAVWTNPADGKVWFFAGGDAGLHGLTVDVDAAGNPSLTDHWDNLNGWTTSIVVANGVVFAAADGGEHTTTGKIHQVQAVDPTTGHILWTGAVDLFHWASPIVVNSTVYMADGNSGGFGGPGGHLRAWRLNGVPTPTPTVTPTITPTPTATPTPTVTPTATPTPTPPVGCFTATATHGFTNTAFTGQSGTFTATFDATATAPTGTTVVNDVIAISHGAQTAIGNFPVIVSFSDTGHFVARNAGVYTASTVLPYTVGATYHFRLIINATTHVYSVFVTPPGMVEVPVANNFTFRTGAPTGGLSSVGAEVTQTTGSVQVCNFAVQ